VGVVTLLHLHLELYTEPCASAAYMRAPRRDTTARINAGGTCNQALFYRPADLLCSAAFAGLCLSRAVHLRYAGTGVRWRRPPPY